MRPVVLSLALGASAALGGCKGGSRPAGPAPRTDSPPAVDAYGGVSCGALECRQYATLEDAFQSTLGSGPLLVAVGEAHAPKGATVASSARRFQDRVLPLLAGRASDLLVELMSPPRGCAKATEAVREEHKAVTETQAPTDQAEYVSMGVRARELGIVPDLLRPSCEDLAAVNAAGEDAVAASLSLIASLTRAQAARLLDRTARSDADAGKLVVLYGGALHNDPTPPVGREAWSFGPALVAKTGGRYVAVELFVPEFIAGTEAWRSRPFSRVYDPVTMGAKTTVFHDGKVYVIVLPRGGG